MVVPHLMLGDGGVELQLLDRFGGDEVSRLQSGDPDAE
jgi:hypothetical protein